MMFLKLHKAENDEKIMLNLDKIQSIYQEKAATYIYIGQIVYRVKESYEEIVEVINKYGNT